jgi:hypothetical protein
MVSSRHTIQLVLLAGALFASSGIAQPLLFAQPKSPRIANYDIDVRLDAPARLLHGRETLRWRNDSRDALTELHFHLYLNAFRNDRSTFMRESRGRQKKSRPEEKSWGYIEIDSLSDQSGADLTPLTSFNQPDDGNKDDKTVLRLLLPRPLPPGETITLRFAFRARLPEPPVARTGIKEEFVMAGQWFPKIGVYEEKGWNCHQFHANSEFYADFGVYRVNITVPRDYIVGATGLCAEQVANPDTTVTHRYYAEDVHDFAWTASPDYVVFTGVSQDVEIRALIQKDHISLGPRYLKAAETAVAWFQDQYGDYPYPNLTVVDPRRGAMSAGGMEYPTLITGFAAYGLPEGLRALEMVVMHEFGHNFWYHLVASNEFEEAWLDEGINTFSEIQILNDTYGEPGSMIDQWGIKLSDTQLQRLSYISQPQIDPILLPAWQYYSNSTYASMSYNKPGLVLVTLQNYLGRETMNKIMRTYFARWQFRHPHTADFIAVVNEISGEDLGWYFDQALHTTALLDYSVSSIRSEKVHKGRGYDFDLTLNGESNPDGKDDDEDDAEDEDEESGALYESTVHVRRLGDFIFPVELEMVFADGDTLLEKWDGRERWKKYSVIRSARLISASVDPKNRIPLDVQIVNNSRTLETGKAGLNKLTARILFWTQFLFDMPQIVNLLTAFSMNQ